jgi:hypothetical protein
VRSSRTSSKPDHFDLTSQVPPDRHHDRLSANPAPFDDAADGRADPACQGIDGLLFLGLEPLAQRFGGAAPYQAAHVCYHAFRCSAEDAVPRVRGAISALSVQLYAASSAQNRGR